ncbi:tRNA (34-2'-O)-methyltransferase regulator WDR6 [Rhinophrynus dorsalis]
MEMESVLLVAPITALEFVGDHLLSGEGPNLTVYSLKQSDLTSQRFCQNVLQGYTIHGIKLSGSAPLNPQHVLLAVFGSKGLIVLKLKISDQEVSLSEICPLRVLHDWIWDVQWLSDHLQLASLLALALGHNSVALYDFLSGTVLKEVHCAEKCILYSADFFGESWEELVMISGTVFNQLVIWRPSDSTNKEERVEPRRRISGHNGVIFSIFYEKNRGILASASDDRSLRIWDVGDLAAVSYEDRCLLVLYGHQSRVWSVRLLPENIVSIGEDSACIVWNYKGDIIHNFKGHKGRGIRAFAVQDQHGWVATGGADSAIRLWQIKGTSSVSKELLSLNFVSSNSTGAPKAISMVDPTLLIVLTDLGSIYTYDFISKQWRFILNDDNYKSYSLLDVLKSSESVLCAIGNITGSIKIFSLSSPHKCQDLKYHQGKVHSLTWVPSSCQSSSMCSLFSSGPSGVMVWSEVTCVSGHVRAVTEKCRFILPACKQRWHTSIAFLPNEDFIVCGDRRGSLMLFSLKADADHIGKENTAENNEVQSDHDAPLRESLNSLITEEHLNPPVVNPKLHSKGPVSLLFGVHGKLGVTSITCHNGFVYSTGRDGFYRQLKVEGGQLIVLRKQKSCKGMEWIERLSFTPDGNLLVLGFHSTDFVVWSTRTNEKLHCVPCGGGHRSWSYKETEHTEMFAYIKSGDIFAYQSHSMDRIQNLLKEPVHGREFTCVKYAGTLKTLGNKHLHILITSSEDTTVNVLCFNEESNQIGQLAILSDHLSSVRTLALAGAQHLQQQDGLLSTLLFTAGGRAEVECYRVQVNLNQDGCSLSCQVIHLASHRLDEHWDRMKNKHRIVKMDPETRYMSLIVVGEKICDISGSASPYVFLAAACSDGSIRIFGMCEQSRCMNLVAESFYHQRCVLKVGTFVHWSAAGQRDVLCSAATDGRIVFWDITSIIDQAHKALEEDQSDLLPLDLGDPCFTISAHQCGINSLSIRETKEGHHLVATGGDDNSIHICHVAVDHTCGLVQETRIQLLQVFSAPSAHAAHVTGLRILRDNLLASVSVDQRLILWNVKDSGLQPVSTRFCHVADVSELDCWENHRKDGHYFVLCGQGMEIVKCMTSKHQELCLES